ncbi:MAG: hypothetical protein WD557_07485 [Dehalococcoidia bacterium]
MKKRQAEQPERRSSPWREIVDVVYAGLAEPADPKPPASDNQPRPISAAR